MKTVLIVFDGWGYREETEFNAIAAAQTPYFDHLWQSFPHAPLFASGLFVGLPEGEMGNSEIGHMTIGAGKVLDTDVVRISKAIETGSIKENQSFKNLFEHIKAHDSVLHIQGLLSPGGIHSHSSHLHGFLRLAKEEGIKKIAIHVFTDGRDTPPQSAALYIRELEEVLSDLGVGFIATAAGRFYAMDRDNNWERIERAEKAIFEGVGSTHQGKKVSDVVESLYAEGVWDEHLEPMVFLDEQGEAYSVKENDGILFFNFRADRARQISRKILEKSKLKNLCFVSLTEYDANYECLVAFPPVVVETTLARELSLAGIHQTHIAETEKYAHATYFLNGKREAPYDLEEHLLIESRKDVATHNLAPEMRAKEIADAAIEKIKEGKDFIFLNFANPDMVGHTADFEATIVAVECVDFHLKRVVEAANQAGMAVLITSDHGNAEMMFDPKTGQKHTAHTSNPVPCILTFPRGSLRQGGSLSDVAPTILSLFQLPVPPSMTGKDLLQL